MVTDTTVTSVQKNDLRTFVITYKGNLSCHIYKLNLLTYHIYETETAYFENFVLRKHMFIHLSLVRILFYLILNIIVDLFVDIIHIVLWINFYHPESL